MADTAFRASRWQRAGATADQVDARQLAWQDMDGDARAAEAARVDSISDTDLAAELAAGSIDPTAGTVDEIIDRVGVDVEAAAVVLSHEQAKARPRKGLVEQLEALIAAAGDGDD